MATQEADKYPLTKNWTVPDLAERCEVDETTIWRRIWSGALGCIQIGRSVRVPESEFQRFLQGKTPTRAYQSSKDKS